MVCGPESCARSRSRAGRVRNIFVWIINEADERPAVVVLSVFPLVDDQLFADILVLEACGREFYFDDDPLLLEHEVDAIRFIRAQMVDRSRVKNTELPKLEADAANLRAEIANLVAALASGGAKADAVVNAITEREQKVADLDDQIRSIKLTPTAVTSRIQRFEREARANFENLRATLMGPVVGARELVMKIFAGTLRFSANGKRYRIEGEVSADTAILCGVPIWASLRGRI